MAVPGWALLAAFAAYVSVSLLMTWPLITEMNDHLPGPSNDSLRHYWDGWWIRRALIEGHRLYHTPYLYHPNGVSLVSHNIAWFNVVTRLILEPVLGGVPAYNWSVLISLGLCGIAAFALALDVVGSRWAAFLAGLLYQTWPFRLYQLDHPNLISTMAIPLFVLFLRRTVREGRWRQGLLTGFFLSLVGYTRWQLLVPAVILGTILFLCESTQRIGSWRQWGPPLVAGAAVVFLALAPPAGLLLEQQRTEPAKLLRPEEEEKLQTDLLAYVTPSGSHSLLSGITGPAYARYYPDRTEARRFPAYVGLIPLLLASLGIWNGGRRTLSWVGMALTMILLALGPVLRINGQLYPGVPMPYRLVARIGVVRLMRFPDRFNLFLALPIAILAAHGIRHVLRFASHKIIRAVPATSVLIAGALLTEYVGIPVELVGPDVPVFYEELAVEEDEKALLNLPLDSKLAKIYMFAQVTHGRPIVQGRVSRSPADAFDYLRSQPWIRTLGKAGAVPPPRPDVSQHMATLADDDVEYVVLHKELMRGHLQHWRHYFPSSPRFEDEEILVYATSPKAGLDYSMGQKLAHGLSVITATLSSPCVSPGQQLGVDVAWGTDEPPEGAFAARVSLRRADGTPAFTQVFPVCDGWSTEAWPADALAWGNYNVQIPGALPAGTYSVTVGLEDEVTGAAVSKPLEVGRVALSEDRCARFHTTRNAVNALFGTELRLLGYELVSEEETLTVTLTWRGERLMQTDYRVLIELYEAETQRQVARHDSMPRNWVAPTSRWQAHEVLTDPVRLSLEGVPKDIYHLAVSVYDPESGKRLPVIDGNGRLLLDHRLDLPAKDSAGPRPVEAGAPVMPGEWISRHTPGVSDLDIAAGLRLREGGTEHRALPAGKTVAVHLVWEALAKMEEAYRLRLSLVNESGIVYGHRDVDILDVAYPTDAWQLGEILQDSHYLPTPEDLSSGELRVVLNLLDENGVLVLAEPVTVAKVWIQSIEPEFALPAEIDQYRYVVLGEDVVLLGHDLPASARAGESIPLTLYWQALRPMTTSYKTFIHVVGESGALVAQRDRIPGLGIRPTTDWQKGEILPDRYYIPVPGDTEPGTYSIAVGLYDPSSGERLARADGNPDTLSPDSVILGPIEIRVP